jgi:hypothetical protein
MDQITKFITCRAARYNSLEDSSQPIVNEIEVSPINQQIMDEQVKKYIEELDEFVKDQDHFLNLYKLKALDVRTDSIAYLGDDTIQSSRLLSLTLLYLLVSSVETAQAKTEEHRSSMILIAGYIQGTYVTTDLILEGNYIKASATLKQDYEIMVRLHEIDKQIHKQKHKEGKPPHPANAPESLRNIYGYTNDIAHIVKEDILTTLLRVEDKNGDGGFAPVKRLIGKTLEQLFIYETFTKMEILRLALILHREIVGEDDVYQRAFTYLKVAMKILDDTKIVKLEVEKAKNKTQEK